MRFDVLARYLVAVLSSLILVACGGGGGGSTPAQPVQNTPPPLAYPIPAGLWAPSAGTMPASGNYVYLQSDTGDYIGAGRTYLHTKADALINLSTNGLTINVGVQGNERWNGSFLLPAGAGNLQAGYFSGLTRTPFADKAVGGVEWYGEGRGCNTTAGWLAVDKITLDAGVVTAIDLRFEQRCEGGGAALHGQVHWTKANADLAQAPAPGAIPSNLWQAAAGSVPTSGSYLYIESRTGDFVGGGRTYLYSPSNARFSVTGNGARLSLGITGDETWNADFQGMQGMSQLVAGYYGGLQRYPFNNPVLGGMSVSGMGHGCNNLSGWFVVDKALYSAGVLTAIDLRFEQYCDGSTVPLHGQLHWIADETSSVPGPLNPPPTGLWAPTGFVAPAGNYVYLVSDNGDYIGGGRTELLTSANTTISVDGRRTAALKIATGGWNGDFVAMNTLSQLMPGYYGGLQRYPFHNPIRGGMNWSGNGRGCNTLTGWFVVDKATYSLGELIEIDLRFEQHCEGGAAALHGVIHWVKP